MHHANQEQGESRLVFGNAKYQTGVRGQGTADAKKTVAAALAADGGTFFGSSPFKVLSPQPAKFLKALLPVKEESKARKALEDRPLLGQEVRKAMLLFALTRSVFLRDTGIVFLLPQL